VRLQAVILLRQTVRLKLIECWEQVILVVREQALFRSLDLCSPCPRPKLIVDQLRYCRSLRSLPIKFEMKATPFEICLSRQRSSSGLRFKKWIVLVLSESTGLISRLKGSSYDRSIDQYTHPVIWKTLVTPRAAARGKC
jgi:hypothetical protein